MEKALEDYVHFGTRTSTELYDSSHSDVWKLN